MRESKQAESDISFETTLSRSNSSSSTLRERFCLVLTRFGLVKVVVVMVVVFIY